LQLSKWKQWKSCISSRTKTFSETTDFCGEGNQRPASGAADAGFHSNKWNPSRCAFDAKVIYPFNVFFSFFEEFCFVTGTVYQLFITVGMLEGVRNEGLN